MSNVLGGADPAVIAPPWPRDTRCVVHMDLDCFYASVEILLNPALEGKPVAVVMGLDAQGRGAVTTASYTARAFGVRSAMTMSSALRLCPELIVLPVRHEIYREHSARVLQVLRRLSPRIEQISIDEAFIELPDPTSGWEALLAARAEILQGIGLSCSFGVATNKLVAKIATGRGKPRGFTVAPPGTEQAFLRDLPVTELWGVGPTTEARLLRMGIRLLGELASADPGDMVPTFGHRRAMELHWQATGMDESPLNLDRRYRSISAERTFGSAEANRRVLWALIQDMAADLGRRLNSEGMAARTIGLKMRLNDWKLVTRDRTLPLTTHDSARIAAVAGSLMRENWQPTMPLRLLGLRVSGLGPRPVGHQLPLLIESGVGNGESS